MATWISHLRVAENLLAAWPDLDEVAFTFGNLAPDSGVPNADWTAFDPPKEVTHFFGPRERGVRTHDLRFYREYLAGAKPDDDRECSSFLLGYFFHLVCDGVWSLTIAQPSKKAYAALFAECGPAKAWDVLKDDWYGLDHRYVRRHPDSLFWRVVMGAASPPMYVPIVPEAALHQQLDHIRAYYTRPKPEPVLARPFPYLNEATLSRYVADSTDIILKIHARLESGPAPENMQTALSLLDGRVLDPYPLPLGDVPAAASSVEGVMPMRPW